jgi:hypothetical protein
MSPWRAINFCRARSNDRPDVTWRRGLGAALLAALAAVPAAAQLADAPAPAPTPAASLADSLGLRASFRAGAWTNDRDLNDETLVTVASSRLRAAPKFGALDGFAEGYVQANSAHGIDGDLVEGWLRLTKGALELRAGRQIIVWGRADRVNPTDALSSRDYTLLVASDDEQRRGTLMTQARLGLGLWTIDGYWLPEFRGNRFPLDLRRPGVAVIPDQQVDDKSQFAVRIDRSGGRVDFALSWFHGTDRTRDFVSVAPPAGFVAGVQQRFPKVDMFGADMAGTAGPIGWRAEIAWSRYRGTDTIFRKNDNLWAVVGVDATVGDGWNLNLQYSLRRIFDYRDLTLVANPVQRAIALQSAAVNNQLDRTQNGMTFRVARKFFADTLDIELATQAYFETGDAAIRPKLAYAITDKLRLNVGADIFVGPSLSYFGRVRSLSGGYLQLTHGF